MTPQQLNAMKLALEALYDIIPANANSEEIRLIQQKAITALKEALAEHAMSEVQRLGQEIEQEQLISDQINYGMSVTQGGKRIDPMSIYKEPEQEPVAHCKVRPLRGDESFPKVEIDWVNQPVPGPLYATPPQRTEQEPVAYYLPHKGFYWAKPTSISAPTIADVEPLPLYTTPPQRKPLTDEQYFEIGQRHWLSSSKVEQIHKELEEAAHDTKEKNT